MSIFVISLVVWLVVVFLSVTTGIEKNWLKKLTSLHAPIRLVPSEAYYASYYYQIDQLAAASNYTVKSIGEKAAAPFADPYSADTDAEVPFYWPAADRLESSSELRDPVKIAFNELSLLKKEIPALAFQDYQIGGALLRLSLQREMETSSLSQMSFLLSLTDENPNLRSLIAEPTPADLNRLLAADPSLLEFISIEEIATDAPFSLPSRLLPINRPFEVFMRPGDTKAILPLELRDFSAEFQKGTVVWDGKQLRFSFPFPVEKASLKLDRPLSLKARDKAREKGEIELSDVLIQGVPISGSVPFKNLKIVKGSARVDFKEDPKRPLPWVHFINGKCCLRAKDAEQAVVLPKNYRESGVLLGDLGTLNYVAPAAVSSQEQRIPIRVVGFYDPGILSVGNKCLLVSPEVTQTIHAATETFSPDGTPSNGIFVWGSGLNDAEEIQKQIEARFEKAGIASYWKVSTYKEFEFSKDLMLQFQSDRTLFLLIAAILLVVACCNVISLLVLLVNDKKKEIAILQSMGASFSSIARIFGFCGAAMGTASCLIGGTLAVITLRHLDSLVTLLSALQGRKAFNPLFFGQNLPNQLSYEALLFVLIATPLLSLAAGLIPALKASRIRPSSALRSE